MITLNKLATVLHVKTVGPAMPFVRHMMLQAAQPDDPDGPVSPHMLLAGVIGTGLQEPAFMGGASRILPSGSRVALYGRYFGAVTPGDSFVTYAALNAVGMFAFPEIPGNVRGIYYQGDPLPPGDKGPRIRVSRMELKVPGYDLFITTQFEGNVLYGGDRLYLETDLSPNFLSKSKVDRPINYALSAHSALLV